MRHRLTRLRRRVLCWLEQHEDLVSTEDGVLRARCLHCGRVTAGWHQGTPGYHRTQEGKVERLHNGRLERCECAGCVKARKQATRGRVAPIRRAG